MNFISGNIENILDKSINLLWNLYSDTFNDTILVNYGDGKKEIIQIYSGKKILKNKKIKRNKNSKLNVRLDEKLFNT